MTVERLLQEVESFGRHSDVMADFRIAFHTLLGKLRMNYEANSQESIRESKFLDEIERYAKRLGDSQ